MKIDSYGGPREIAFAGRQALIIANQPCRKGISNGKMSALLESKG